MKEDIIYKLISEAKDASSLNFCCKYTNFSVGAALLTKDNEIYKGFNIENNGIQSICAERVAFAKALSNNKREFVAIAVVSKYVNENQFKKILPCGYCRQFLYEYGGKDLIVYTVDENNKLYTYRLSELLPHCFEF